MHIFCTFPVYDFAPSISLGPFSVAQPIYHPGSDYVVVVLTLSRLLCIPFRHSLAELGHNKVEETKRGRRGRSMP